MLLCTAICVHWKMQRKYKKSALVRAATPTGASNPVTHKLTRSLSLYRNLVLKIKKKEVETIGKVKKY